MTIAQEYIIGVPHARAGRRYNILNTASFLIGLAAAQVSVPAAVPPPNSFSYTGNFAADDDKREVFFTLAAPGTVTVKTVSYAGGVNAAGTVVPGGGFDPTLSLFDASGVTLAVNRDGGCGTVAKDAVTSSCWDAFLSATLPAGNYRVVLTQSDNAAAGPNLSDSFLFNGQGNFTQPPGNAPPGFWDYYPNQRTSFYALDIQGATSSQLAVVTSSAKAPPGITGQPYAPFTLTAQGGAGVTFTWTATGALPPGITLSSGGVLQGTPTSKGTFSFTVKADDGVQPVQQTVTLAVYDPLSVTTALLPQATAGQAYGPFSIAAIGGSGTYAWSSPNLPAGLSISSSGQIGGIAPAAGFYPGITINVTDAPSGQSATRTVSLTVAAAPSSPLLITSSGNLPGIALGTPINAVFAAVGGKPPYSWTATNLPTGLAINTATGAVSGTPSLPGNYNFLVQVTDSQPVSASLAVTLPVLGIVTSSLPPATTVGPYSVTIVATGGTPPYTFSATGLPDGLTLSLAGLLTGTPVKAGNYTLSVLVKDAAGVASASTFSLAVGGSSALTVSGGPLSGGTLGTAYSDRLTATGGTPPYSWTLTGGALPDGLSLSSSGAVTGLPAKAGAFTFTAQVRDAASTSLSATFTIVIAAGQLVLSTGNSLPGGMVGADYPLQALSASGGTLPYTFAITGGSLPPGLALSNGQITGTPSAAGSFSFTVTVTDAAGKTASSTFSIVINPAQADLILSQTSLSFSLTTGATTLPDGDSVPVRSSVVQQILNYSTSSTVPWLDVTGGGTTPGSIGVSLNNTALSLAAAAAPYTATVTVTCVAPSPCAGHAQTILVSLLVSSPPAELELSGNFLSFVSTTASPARVSHTFGIKNKGGGTLGILSITAADSWLTVSESAGLVTVTADPTGLGAGYYRSSITVVSSAGSATVYVGLLIATAPIMTLSPAAAQFQLPAGGALGNSNGSFEVGSPANWTAAVSGAAWLSASATSANKVNFSIDPVAAAGLAVGTYFGTIRITSTGVVNSPLDFQVVLNVTSASESVKPNPSPGGLVFISSGTGTLPPQTVQVYASSVTPLAYQASVSSNATGWLSVSPATGTTSAAAPAQSIVTVNAAGLKPGIYRAGVSYAFSSAAVRTVNITLLILAATSTAAPAQGCTPTQLVPAQVGLVHNFAQLATLPTPVSVLVVDDCGTPVTGAQVTISFSNGDAPLNLVAVNSASGIYSGTWTPVGVSSQVTVTARTTATGFPPATTQITGEVLAKSGPVLAQNGTLHVYNPLIGGAIAPGTILQIYGSNLAAQAVPSSTVPLTPTLGGTSVSIGGIPAPLYYVSPGQINAQAPFELVPGKQYQVVVNSAGALTSPASINISGATPGIAAFANGFLIAQHPDLTLVSETLPAKPGETIVLYLSGLGATDKPVTTGAASPSNPLARPTTASSLTLNGVPAPIQFVGLSPGSVGLYQVNLTVPPNTPDGDLPLVLTQAGSPSNLTILPVKR